MEPVASWVWFIIIFRSFGETVSNLRIQKPSKLQIIFFIFKASFLAIPIALLKWDMFPVFS